MDSSRTTNSKRNIIWSYLEYFITIIFSFVSRTVIVYYLGANYLGLSSLFTSILQVLNVAELGFSVAITYNMYKPIADNNIDTVCALLNFYKKVYQIIGIIVFVAGIIIMPFVPALIKGEWPQNLNIFIIYFIFLVNTSVSYFLFSYKAALLNALQRLDLTKIAYCTVNVLQYALQLIAIVFFENYYIFAILMVLGTASKNIYNAYISKKKFPQYECRGTLSKEVKKSIANKVRGLLICNVSAITYTTFDSIILSAMIGLSSVAIYNNYLIVFNGLTSVIVIVRMGMQASIGNSVASESVEKNYKDIFKWQFQFSAIAMFCTICLVCVYQPFMKWWMGEEMLLKQIDSVLLSLLFFISTIQHAYYLYLNAAGLWLEMRWVYIFSAVLNIIMNFTLCRLMGTTGIIVATLVANIISGLIWQPIIVFRSYFRKPIGCYFAKQLYYLLLTVIVGCGCLFLCSLVDIDGLVGIFLRLGICSCSVFMVGYIIFRKNEAFISCLEIVKRIISN